jgi:hypothetical protein
MKHSAIKPLAVSLLLGIAPLSVATVKAAPENVPNNSKHESKHEQKKPFKSNDWTLTHHYEAKKDGAKWVYWRLVRDKDKRIIQEVIPYGRTIASHGSKLKTYGVKNFHTLLKARMRTLKSQAKKKANKAAPQSPNVASTSTQVDFTSSQLGWGYNPSTGYLPDSTCSSTTVSLDNSYSQLSFSSSGSANTSSGQTDINGSISASYNAAATTASASEVFTLSNSYATSSLTSTAFYNAYQVYEASVGLQTINDTGNNALNAGTFATVCGSNQVNSMAVGMLITGQSSFTANSSTAMSALGSTTAAGASTEGFTGAVTVAYDEQTSNSEASYTAEFTTTVLGGGEGASGIFTTDWTSYAIPYVSGCSSSTVTKNPPVPPSSVSTTNTTGCCTPSDTSACSAFNSASTYATTEALTQFSTDYGPTAAATTSDIGLYPFPNGIAGLPSTNYSIAATETNTLCTPGNDCTDPYSTYGAQISNYLGLLNQIGTLYMRAQYLTKALTTKNGSGTSYSPTMNPSPALDISGSYLGNLVTLYKNDYNTIFNNLTICLNDTSNTNPASTACAPIIAANTNNILTAYDWYSSTTNGQSTADNNIALQNTIALQYSGSVYVPGDITNSPNNANINLDVVWGQSLPLFPLMSGLPSGVLAPSQLPALIAFADAPYDWVTSSNPTDYTSPFVVLMPSIPGAAPTLTQLTSSFMTTGYTLGEVNNYSTLGWQGGSGTGAQMVYNNCTSTTNSNFTQPCPIEFLFNDNQELNISPIEQFFE